VLRYVEGNPHAKTSLIPPCVSTEHRLIKDKSNVLFLFYLLPAKRYVQLTTRLRCARQYPTIYARTNRYKNSFILFGSFPLMWFCVFCVCMIFLYVCLIQRIPAFRGCQNPINGLFDLSPTHWQIPPDSWYRAGILSHGQTRHKFCTNRPIQEALLSQTDRATRCQSASCQL